MTDATTAAHRPSLGPAGWLLVGFLLLNALGPVPVHLGWFGEVCGGWEDHGLLDHVDRTQAPRLLPALALVLLLARHRWALVVCAAWAGWLVLATLLSLPAVIERAPNPVTFDLAFLVARVLLAWFVMAVPRGLLRRGALG